MNTFHKIIERVGTGFLGIIFVFVALYVPLPHTGNVSTADASGVFGKVTDVYNGAVNTGTMISTSASASSNAVTANAATQGLLKDNTLDAVAWGLAKSVLSEMTSSIVDWINNGFEGSPAFVQDLQGFLTKAADKEFGKYLKNIGGPLSSICSPFKLDIQVALALDYKKKQQKENSASSACTLTGALKNLDQFTKGDFSQGGWDTWFKVISNPSDYTKTGAYYKAQSGADAAVATKKAEEQKLLDFGGGFLSSKVCDKVSTSGGKTEEKCKVSTPGKVIQEALTFQLQTGPLSLVEADEINEVIAALFGQLAKQAITGASGLLGLSNDTGHTTYVKNSKSKATSSVTSNTKTETTISDIDFHSVRKAVAGSPRDEMAAINERERDYRDRIEVELAKLKEYAASTTAGDAYRRSLAEDEIKNIEKIKEESIYEIDSPLHRLQEELWFLPHNPEDDTPAEKAERNRIMQNFAKVQPNTEEEIEANILNWQRIYRQIDNNEEEEDEESANKIEEHMDRRGSFFNSGGSGGSTAFDNPSGGSTEFAGRYTGSVNAPDSNKWGDGTNPSEASVLAQNPGWRGLIYRLGGTFDITVSKSGKLSGSFTLWGNRLSITRGEIPAGSSRVGFSVAGATGYMDFSSSGVTGLICEPHDCAYKYGNISGTKK